MDNAPTSLLEIRNGCKRVGTADSGLRGMIERIAAAPDAIAFTWTPKARGDEVLIL